MTRRVAKQPAPESDKSAVPSPGVREHILDRTIYLMGTLGTTDVSVRAIAREAGVNVAAVNYYFTSKEQMLEQMADRFLKGFTEVMRLLETPGLPPEERLRLWAAEVMRYLAEYPGVLALMERQIGAEPLDAFGLALRGAVQQAMRQMKATLREMVGEGDEQRLAFKLTLLISALAGPFPRQLDRGPERRGFRAPAKRARFLDLLLEHLRQ
jgi:AcrR family transcriptional regulator